MTRHVAGAAEAMVLTFQTSAFAAGLMSLALLWVWLAPTPEQWLMLASVGVFATFGPVPIIKASEQAEAPLLAPLACQDHHGHRRRLVVLQRSARPLDCRESLAIFIASAVQISFHKRRAAIPAPKGA